MPPLPSSQIAIDRTPSEAVFGVDRTVTGTIQGDLLQIVPAAGALRDDLIYGFGGNDTISAGRGNDWISGGDGNDVVADTGGGDHIFGEAGNDRIDGRGLNDWLDGGDGNDILLGSGGTDTLLGGFGSDRISGGNARDTMLGGGGGDQMLGQGAGDSLDGGGGNDLLSGGADSDTLIGSRDDDTLEGGQGGDVLIGGEGADIFVFGSHEESQPGQTRGSRRYDQIRAASETPDATAEAIESADRIDLSAIDADPVRNANQAFAWGGAFEGGARTTGTLHLIEKGTDTLVVASLDADGAWELRIEIEDGARGLDWYGRDSFIL